jgi:hypothetical protein
MSDAAKDQQDFLEMVTKVLEGVEGVIAVLPDAANLTLGVRREGFEDVFLALRPLYEELASTRCWASRSSARAPGSSRSRSCRW